MADELSAAASGVLQQTLRSLAAQNRILLQSSACKTLPELKFHILNHTIGFCQYDRAVLIDSKQQKIIGVSGTISPDTRSEIAKVWLALAMTVGNPQERQFISLSALSLQTGEDLYNNYSLSLAGVELLWISLGEGGPVLILERWGGKGWRDKEAEALELLVESFGNHWRLLQKAEHHFWQSILSRYSRKSVFKVLLIIGALLLFPLRQRIVAPCEVVAQSPLAITARIDGIVEKVLVKPGEHAQRGQVLVQFDSEIVQQEYNAALQSLRESFAHYSGIRAETVNDPQLLAQLSEMASKLRQERARLKVAEYRLNNLTITAPESGSVIITDPHDWEGRPVSLGERIMLLSEPHKSMVRIFLPQNDRIDFPDNAEVKVILKNAAASSHQAVLRYVSSHAQPSLQGGSSFVSEADWVGTAADVPLGVSGTAIIYGSRVPLFYWLLRRPLSAMRNFLGV